MCGKVERRKGTRVYQPVSCSSVIRYYEYRKSQNKTSFRGFALTPDKYIRQDKRGVYRLVGYITAYDIAFEVFEKWLGIVKVVNEDLSVYGFTLKVNVEFSENGLDVSGIDVDLVLVAKSDLVEVSYKDFLKIKDILNSYLEVEKFY